MVVGIQRQEGGTVGAISDGLDYVNCKLIVAASLVGWRVEELGGA